MKQWLVEAITDARSILDQLVAEQLIEAEQQLSMALDEALSRRIDAIDAELKDVDKTIKMGAQERAKHLSVVTKRLREVSEGRDRAEAFLSSIRSLRDKTQVPTRQDLSPDETRPKSRRDKTSSPRDKTSFLTRHDVSPDDTRPERTADPSAIRFPASRSEPVCEHGADSWVSGLFLSGCGTEPNGLTVSHNLPSHQFSKIW
jgi:hypothetical protein